MYRKKLFAVFGDPILHSKSPVLWSAAFKKFKFDAHYFRVKCSDPKFTTDLIKTLNIKCSNITSPMKETICYFVDALDPVAKEIGAVNTVINKSGRLLGYNTDWIGIIQALKLNRINPKNKKVVILGAGGAARAAVYGMLKSSARDIVIANRTFDKANLIAIKNPKKIRAIPFKNFYSELVDAEILISCVPAFDLKNIPKKVKILCADYTDQKKNINMVKGTDWLLFQAVESFKYVFKKNPLKAMKVALHGKVSNKRKISFIGFMGCGKTSVSTQLASLMKCKSIDTDNEISKKEGKSISEIFRNSGENYFRSLERIFLKKSISSCARIISTGGGIIINDENCKKLKDNTLRVWLWSDLAQIMNRIDKSTRPLLSEKIFMKRIFMYACNCDLCIVSQDIGKTARSVFDEINRACSKA